MRLIDSDKLIEEGYVLERIYQKDSTTMVLEKRKIEDVPVVDAVPVVRCEYCQHKYYDKNQIICQKIYWCDGNNFEPFAEDFCSRGKRREEEGE